MNQLGALALSIAIEALVLQLVARRLEADRWRLALVAAGGTLLTHPFAWRAMLAGYEHAPVGVVIGVVEVLVSAAEAVAYRFGADLSWRRAGAASLLANATSTALGILMW